MKKRIKTFCFAFAAILLGLMIAFSIGEITTRLLLPAPQRVTIKQAENLNQRLQSEREKNESLNTSHNITAAYVSTETGMRMRANLHVTVERQSLSKQPIEIRTNSLGYRNPELGEKTKTRILFLGDSITVNEALPEEETFIRIIEKQSDQDGYEWETINTGVSGISTQNELAILHETGLSTQPDIVVIGFYLNDYQESPGVFVPVLPYGLNNSRFIYHTTKMATLLMAEYNWSRKYVSRTWSRLIRKSLLENFPPGEGDFKTSHEAFNGLIWEYASDWGGAWSEHAWEIWEPLFEEFIELSTKHEFQLMVVAFPVRYQVEADYIYDYPQQRLKELTDRLDIPTLDLLPMFRDEHQNNNEVLFFDHCHHTAYANQRIADEVYQFLRTNVDDE